MTPGRNGKPNLQNPLYSWLALGTSLFEVEDSTNEPSNQLTRLEKM